MTAFNLLVILGPTASGKTRLAVDLARNLSGEIISADSRQVYRGMDIGTGKDLAEYGEVPFHLIDIIDPGLEFSVFQFQRLFYLTFADIASRGRLPLLAGGTGMYIDAVLSGYRLVEAPEDPGLRRELAHLSLTELAERLERLNPRRHNTTDTLDRDRLVRAIEIASHKPEQPLPSPPEIAPLVFGIHWERDALRNRITERLRTRLSNGMIEEVAGLRKSGISWETLDYFGLEYRYVAKYLKGELNRNDLFQKLNSAIHDFAKRQGTWFRRMEARGTIIHWLNGAQDPLAQALAIIANRHRP